MTNGKSICTVCNYIYDEALGESRQNIPPALKFDKLSDEWRCPECGSAKEMFQPCSCVSIQMNDNSCIAHSRGSSAFAIRAFKAAEKTTAVGQLVADSPARACVLEAYAIDYCCGGKLSLEEACLKKGVPVDEVLEKLGIADQKAGPDKKDWTVAKLKDLIEHIVSAYHQPLRQELLRISQLSEKVARVHGENHPEMLELKDIFNHFKAQLELHMQKEEMVLFPGIISMELTGSPQIFGCGGGIEHPIEVMSQEHDEAGEALCTMRKLTHDYTPPEDACSTFKVLLFSLAQLESEMHQHVHKENNILFPRALALCKPALSC